MADRLLEGLHDKELTGYVAEEGQRVPPPRLELFITRWDAFGGERISSVVGTLLFGAAAAAHADDLEVECSVVREGDVTYRRGRGGY